MGIKAVILKDKLGIIAFTLEQMGFEIAAFYEEDKRSAEMCRHNLKSGCIQKELLECQEADIPDMEFLAAQVPGGMSVQPGKREGADLVWIYLRKYLEIIYRKRPRIILFEFHSRAIRHERFPEFSAEIRNMGYQYMYQICDIGEMTGLPVTEKRMYFVGILAESGMSFHFPEEPETRRETRRPGDICCSENTVEPWYLKLPAGRIDFSEEQETHFYCWRTESYVAKERIDWNGRKIPLVYNAGVLRKLTHREMARMKGLPDEFYLDTGNKSWLYRNLMHGSNAVLIRRIAEAVRRLLDGDGKRNRQMINAYRFENLLEKYLRYKKVDFTDGNRNREEQVDFVLTQGDKQILVETKWYNSNTGIENRIFQWCELFQNQKGKRSGSCVLVTGSRVEENFKRECLKKYGIAVWDVKNLLWMFEEFPDIRSEFVSMLNYTIGDLVPEKPELEFGGEESRKEDAEEEREREETQEPLKQYRAEEKEEVPVNFRERLAEIQPGKEGAAPYKYEELATEILKHVFGDYLTLWEKQRHSNDEMYRFDLCCKIKHGSQPEFFDTIKDFFRTKYVVFEFKNYSKMVTQEEIYTTEKYLYQKALRSVAVIVSRKGADKNALRAARGCLRENGKLILCLSDEDLLELLRIKEEGERATAEFLGDMLDEMLICLEK